MQLGINLVKDKLKWSNVPYLYFENQYFKYDNSTKKISFQHYLIQNQSTFFPQNFLS